jgi:hypothetical protein
MKQSEGIVKALIAWAGALLRDASKVRLFGLFDNEVRLIRKSTNAIDARCRALR